MVRTGSMAPSIRPGDVVVDVPAKNVRPGEVITFARAAGSYTTHRVVAVTARGIQTKGDANPSPDYGYVTPSEVAGREVAVVPKAGYVLEFLSHPEGLASLALFLLAAWFGWGLLTPAHDRRSVKGRHAVRPKHQAGANEPVISLRERDLTSPICPNGHPVSENAFFCSICRAAVTTGDVTLIHSSSAGSVLAGTHKATATPGGGGATWQPASPPLWPDGSARRP